MPVSRRYTLGFLSSWHVYEGAAIEPFSNSLIRGVSTAAADFGCNLLVACGVGPLASERAGAPAWPSLDEKSACFVPVGPWNTDGLVVLPTELTAEQSGYLQDLRKRGYPVVFAGPGEPGISVTGDNAGGIRQAVLHLCGHGYRRIAFIAGIRRARGDSAQRREAYSRALVQLGLPEDPALVAYGLHSFAGGQLAMRQLLASAALFDAVIASNDRSALGAISVLQEQGRRVPEDVAVIGFDDIPEAKACSPALTTLRNPSVAVGYQAVLRLLEEIEGRGRLGDTILPAPLIVRQSCGCAAFTSLHPWTGAEKTGITVSSAVTGAAISNGRLASEMTDVVMNEVLYTSRTIIGNQCHILADRFVESIREQAPEPFLKTLVAILDRTEEQEEDVLAWNQAISVLRSRLPWLDFKLPAARPGALPQAALIQAAIRQSEALLDAARLDISERARRVYARSQIQRAESTDRLSLMTAQLLSTLEEAQVQAVLDQHLSPIGIRRMLGVLIQPDETDPVEQSEVFHSFGFERSLAGERFPSRQFPPAGWFPAGSPVQLALLPMALPGQRLGYAVFETRNLTSLGVIVRSLESALRTNQLFADAVLGRQMAEDANQMKSRFLSMVSHELRTPLNVIVGLSEILLRDENPPQGIEQDLDRIYANAQHLSRLIGDVLDLVSSGSGHLRLYREPLDLAEVYRPVITTGEQMARGKGLAWITRLPEHGPYVLGDRTRLRQAALNLVSNAVKFTTRGSITFDVFEAGSSVTVSVCDTGIGIPLEEQHKLFSEFGQSELSIKRGLSGMGLGLAITRELIERQGGRIGVQSSGEEGSGSTFFFTLPSIPPPPAAPSPAQSLEMALRTAGQAARLMLLTDRADAGKPLAAKLAANGYALEICGYQNNEEWLLHLLDSPPAAIIIDEALAANHGWEIVAMLKRSETTARLPVLICTLNEGKEGAVLALDYQLKPLTGEEMSRALNQHSILSAPATILIVDDDAAIRFYHSRLVQHQLPECRVLQAENGRVAQEILRQTRPDLVLLDLLMPEVDGFSVLEFMRQQVLTRDVPVIILTAKAITEEDIAQLNKRVAAVLTKGVFSGAEIAGHIAQVLNRIPGLGTASQRLVRHAIAYIQAHYSEALTRDQIAEYVSVTPDHLSDCFHQEMGITPMAYLNRYRVAAARKLLEEGDRNITQVALEVGFSDSAHFSRVFQREVGMSPRTYQKNRG